MQNGSFHEEVIVRSVEIDNQGFASRNSQTTSVTSNMKNRTKSVNRALISSESNAMFQNSRVLRRNSLSVIQGESNQSNLNSQSQSILEIDGSVRGDLL